MKYFVIASVVGFCWIFRLINVIESKIKNEMKTEIEKVIETQVETLLASMETVLVKPVKFLEYKLNNQDRRQAYMLQTLKASIQENDDLKICIKRIQTQEKFHLGCFTETFCLQSLPIDIQEIEINVESCLQPFYNLKRIKQSGIQDVLPDALENVFVEELHLVSSQDLDLKGIEKMPYLRTLTFENCKNIFLQRLFSTTTHNIQTIYAINTPCLLQYKSKLKTIDIELIELID